MIQEVSVGRAGGITAAIFFSSALGQAILQLKTELQSCPLAVFVFSSRLGFFDYILPRLSRWVSEELWEVTLQQLFAAFLTLIDIQQANLAENHI